MPLMNKGSFTKLESKRMPVQNAKERKKATDAMKGAFGGGEEPPPEPVQHTRLDEDQPAPSETLSERIVNALKRKKAAMGQ